MKYYAMINGRKERVKVIDFRYDNGLRHTYDGYNSAKEVEVIEGKFKGARAVIEPADLIRE